MPFIFTPNTTAEIWFSRDVAPWIDGAPPDAADVPVQQVRPFFDVAGNSPSGFSENIPYTERLFIDGSVVLPATASTPQFETLAVLRLAGDDRFWYSIMAIQAHVDDDTCDYQQLWCKRIRGGGP